MGEFLEGEKIIKKTMPHPAAFWPYYLLFIYYIIMSIVMIARYNSITAYLESLIMSLFGEIGVVMIFLVIWWIVLIIPALIFSILNISWRWVIIYFLIGVVGTYWVLNLHADLFDLYYLTMSIAFVGIILTELYRRGHEYILTNYRIIARLGFLGLVERDIFYSRITDVFLQQGLLGRIFGYGSIIPITAAGIGTGDDSASVITGIGGSEKIAHQEIGAGIAIQGEKRVRVPRGRSSFILYGVANPGEIQKIIAEYIHKKEPTTYLEKTVKLLEKMVKEE